MKLEYCIRDTNFPEWNYIHGELERENLKKLGANLAWEIIPVA